MTWQHQREIVFTWFDRGEQERETFHGFICSWIALNAALSARYAVGGDRAKVRLLGQELEPLCTVRIVCHSFKPLKKIELAECVEELAGEQNVEFAFLTVGTEHPFAISDLAQEGEQLRGGRRKGVYAPERGTIVQVARWSKLLTSAAPATRLWLLSVRSAAMMHKRAHRDRR